MNWLQLMCKVHSKRLFNDFSSVFDGSFNEIISITRITIVHGYIRALTEQNFI